MLYAIPTQYRLEPRLSTIIVESEETERLNHAVQVYAREAIFYRTDRPEVTDEFRAAKHLRYASSRNVVETMVHSMPGVPDRDTSLDFLEDIMKSR